jgi:hypothetical protein
VASLPDKRDAAGAWLMEVENGLAAHFTQKDGASRPGVMWAVKLKRENSEKVYTVMVKTLFVEGQPVPENEYQAECAMEYVNTLLAQGWTPDKGIDRTIDHTVVVSGQRSPGSGAP